MTSYTLESVAYHETVELPRRRRLEARRKARAEWHALAGNTSWPPEKQNAIVDEVTRDL